VHSEEWPKNFSQELKQRTAALEAVAKEEHADNMLTPWEMELEMLEDWLNHPEPVDDCHEETIHANDSRGAFRGIAQNFQPGS
jgi:hypothetical protein